MSQINFLQRVFLNVLPLALVLFSSCASTPEEQWTTATIKVSNAKVLHEVIMMSMSDLGYPLGKDSSPGASEVISGWMESRSPFYGRGFRRKAFVKYTYKGLGEHSIECRVEREVNESHQGLDEKRDQWKRIADDNQRRGHLLAKIGAYLAPKK